MKNVMKAIVFTFAMCFSFLLIGGEAEAARLKGTMIEVGKPTITRVSDKEFASMYKGAKASTPKSAVNKMYKYLMKRKKTFTITLNWENGINLDDVLNAIGEKDKKKTSDDADFIKGGITYIVYSGYYNSKGKMITRWNISYTESAAQVKKVNKTSKSVLKKLKVSKMSDVAKVKTIHDYVVNLITYDYSLKDHSAYGGLTAKKHSTVCQGYALIMYKLLTDAGVPCHYVTGDAGGGPHAWNIVKINKKWYHLDSTWDDPSDTLVYDYFLVGSKTIKSDHATDKYYTKKYKISSKDLDWATLIEKSKVPSDKIVPTDQTDDEIEAGNRAREREDALHDLNDIISEVFTGDEAEQDELDIVVNDMAKMIYQFIIERLADKTFSKLRNDDETLDYYIKRTHDLIMEYLIDPVEKYLEKDDIEDQLFEALLHDIGEEELAEMPEDSLEPLVSLYFYEAVTNKFYEQMDEYGEYIISTVVDELNEMCAED